MWILNTGAQCQMFPQSYPNWETAHRRLPKSLENDVIRAMLTKLAKERREECEIDASRCSMDAAHNRAKKVAIKLGQSNAA